MPRRAYNNAEVYDDESLVAAGARVIHDTGKSKVEVKVRGQETIEFQVDGRASLTKRGRDRIYSWSVVDGGTLTAISQGCACGK